RDGGRGLILVQAVSERWGYYYPATDPVSPRRPAALDQDAPQFLAAPLLPAAGEPGKIVWGLLAPPGQRTSLGRLARSAGHALRRARATSSRRWRCRTPGRPGRGR